MKRLAALTIAAAALAAAPAHASVPIGANICTLHAYSPSTYNGWPRAHGRIDMCVGSFDGTNYAMELKVCLQVRTASGGWATKNETCVTDGPSKVFGMDAYSNPASDAVHGHMYRTWDWGYAAGASSTYVSGGWTF